MSHGKGEDTALRHTYCFDYFIDKEIFLMLSQPNISTFAFMKFIFVSFQDTILLVICPCGFIVHLKLNVSKVFTIK